MEQTRLEATLSWLVDTASDLTPANSLDDALDRYLTRLVQWLRADQGSIMLVTGDGLSLAASVGLNGTDHPAGPPVSTAGPAYEVLTQGQPRLVQGLLASDRETPRPE